jgi:hypothetical protein
MAPSRLSLAVLVCVVAVCAGAALAQTSFPFYPAQSKCTCWRARDAHASAALLTCRTRRTDPFRYFGCYFNGTFAFRSTSTPINAAAFTVTQCAAACRNANARTWHAARHTPVRLPTLGRAPPHREYFLCGRERHLVLLRDQHHARGPRRSARLGMYHPVLGRPVREPLRRRQRLCRGGVGPGQRAGQCHLPALLVRERRVVQLRQFFRHAPQLNHPVPAGTPRPACARNADGPGWLMGRAWAQIEMFPESAGNKLSSLTPTQLAIRSAVLSSNFSANLNFTSPGFLNITYAFVSAGFNNQLGVFLFFPNGTIIRGSLVQPSRARTHPCKYISFMFDSLSHCAWGHWPVRCVYVHSRQQCVVVVHAAGQHRHARPVPRRHQRGLLPSFQWSAGATWAPALVRPPP